MSLTEETIQSEQVYDGDLLKVFRDDVRLPDGGSSHREWVNHPGAAAVVPLFDDGTTILVRQFRYPPRRSFLELPAGKFDENGEAAESVAGRELEEETGWKAETLVHLGESFPCIGYSNEVIHFFLATDLTEGRQELGTAEFLDVVRMPLEEAFRMMDNGELYDMKTTTGLQMVRRHLERNESAI